MQLAEQAWERDYPPRWDADGFTEGQAASTVFLARAIPVRLVVHGDDSTFLGPEEELVKVDARMAL